MQIRKKITTDIVNLSKSVSEKSGSNVIISGLVPRKGYLIAKVRNTNNRLRDYCTNRIFNFLKHDNINAKINCNIFGLHLNSKGVSLFNESFVNLLNTLYSENWHNDQNSEGNKTVNTEVSEDSVATDNETDGFSKGFCVKSILRTCSLFILILIHWETKERFLNLW